MKEAKVLSDITDTGGVLFDCPGCGAIHRVVVRGQKESAWTWNGSYTKPTFVPSISAQWTERGQLKVCHSFITEGQIKFLDDCTHKHAGATLNLPEWGT